jgi:hypothetical protein
MSGIITDILKLKTHQGYSRDDEYRKFKSRASKLVGYLCEKKELCDTVSYEAVIQMIDRLLPPDSINLYSNGMPEGVSLDI